MVEFIAASTHRGYLAFYWLTVLGVAVVWVWPASSFVRTLTTLQQRKYFHAIALLLFVPVSPPIKSVHITLFLPLIIQLITVVVHVCFRGCVHVGMDGDVMLSTL